MSTPEELIKEGEKLVAEAEEAPQEGEQEEEQEENPEEDESRPVVSSMLAEVAYDRQSETLEVTFNNGRTEDYPCSSQQWSELKEAESPGKFMHQNFL